MSERGLWRGGGDRLWGTPWHSSPLSGDVLGAVHRGSPGVPLQTSWWRAQSMKYLLRFPSPYLCHLTNRVRHAAFGHEVALRVAEAEIRHSLLSPPAQPNRGVAVATSTALQEGEWRERAEPYMPRPIVSIHVRQGDKASEMRLFSFAAHMWMAQRLRFRAPDVANIWLSTESQVGPHTQHMHLGASIGLTLRRRAMPLVSTVREVTFRNDVIGM